MDKSENNESFIEDRKRLILWTLQYEDSKIYLTLSQIAFYDCLSKRWTTSEKRSSIDILAEMGAFIIDAMNNLFYT